MINAHYIANQWQASTSLEDIPVIDPSSGETYSSIARGTAADIDKRFDSFFFNSEFSEVFFSFVLVEEPHNSDAILIVDSAHHICIPDVVHPRDVLISDAFNPVTSESVHQECRTLKGFGRGNLQMRIEFFEIISRGNRAGGTCRGNKSGHS